MTAIAMPHASTIAIRDRCIFCGASMGDPGPCPQRPKPGHDADEYERELLVSIARKIISGADYIEAENFPGGPFLRIDSAYDELTAVEIDLIRRERRRR